MQNIQKNTPLANNHISVDCVVIGFDGEQLKVLLVKRAGEDNGEVYHDMKLPGSLIYMDKNLDEHQACWIALKEVKTLAFDHNLIIKEAMTYIRQFVEFNPSMLFELLSRKFTAAQLRTLFELVYDKVVDVRNFHKKIAMMEYVVPLEEKQQGVAHRAARYYKFDKKIYNKVRR